VEVYNGPWDAETTPTNAQLLETLSPGTVSWHYIWKYSLRDGSNVPIGSVDVKANTVEIIYTGSSSMFPKALRGHSGISCN